jgi:hypothetical protein
MQACIHAHTHLHSYIHTHTIRITLAWTVVGSYLWNHFRALASTEEHNFKTCKLYMHERSNMCCVPHKSRIQQTEIRVVVSWWFAKFLRGHKKQVGCSRDFFSICCLPVKSVAYVRLGKLRTNLWIFSKIISIYFAKLWVAQTAITLLRTLHVSV